MRREVEIMLSDDKTLEDFFDPNRDPKERYKQVKELLDLKNFDEDEWTFRKADTKEFTHTIFSQYPARMIPQIARKLIKNYYPEYTDETKKKPILDPFAGSGTTGTEAILRNIDAITFDLNPLAHLIQKVKTSLVNPNKLKTKYKEIHSIIQKNKGKKFENYIPKNFNLDFWYKKEAARDLSLIRFAIETAFGEEKLSKSKQDIKDFFLICFGITARITSYQRLGEHKTYRIPKNKIEKFDKKVNAIETFKEIFNEYLRGKMFLYNYYKTHKYKAKCKPVLGDSMILKQIKENSIDLIVTSPPYGDSHTTVAYGQFSRFPLEWIFLDLEDLAQIDSKLLGGKRQEKILEKSSLLNSTIQKILLNEIVQQNEQINNAFETHNKIIEEYSEKNQFVKSLYDDFYKEFISTDKIENTIKIDSSSHNLLGLKHEYFKKIKNLKSIWKQIKKELKSMDYAGIFEDIKIYEDRIGYVVSFFNDFYLVFKRLYEVLDYNRKCCFVIGNRTVKSVLIPNDEIIVQLGRNLGFEYVDTFYREIPGKRIPKKTAPSNIEGEVESTIEKESIIILSKK